MISIDDQDEVTPQADININVFVSLKIGNLTAQTSPSSKSLIIGLIKLVMSHCAW
jgi:hypothetical protein